MLILIPPSEGKSIEPGYGKFRDLEPQFVKDVRPILRHLKSLDADAAGRFMGIKDSARLKNQLITNAAVLSAPAVQALDRYSGVVYQHIEINENKALRREAENRLLIVSGMFGLIRGSTQISNYKLPLNSWITRYWQPINSKRLQDWAGSDIVLDLLPKSHAKAIAYGNLFRVEFKLDDGKKLAGHFGKAIKGRFIRWVLENKVTSPEQFDRFTEEGYRFEGNNFTKKG